MTETAPKRTYGGRSVEQRRADRRRRLIDAGLELFGTVGFAATSVARLANVAGLSTRQFYEEFTDREALLLAVYDTVQTDAADALQATLRDHPDEGYVSRLPRLLRVYLGSTTSDLRRARVAYVEIIGVSRAVEQHRIGTRRQWSDFILDTLTEAADRGEIERREFSLSTAAFIGAVNGMMQDWTVIEPRPPIDAVVEEMTRMVLHGLVDLR
ncbi:TetR family transcriptional regulator [Herbihabitans rhizosphaerae]|uniref:TetR family transcriptional regulator n=1 Tax=Herbihabitans rhizosphaerae TaxID=1872711 RepID=A0A4Q7KN83_9PSEU|nr:TetR/AcrR family transcriptional regulator [Herbihabitans rhizosphaerae]RZS37786.1 TetR family transcriptional regulator [Herbihabitans rhizosphaerae]